MSRMDMDDSNYPFVDPILPREGPAKVAKLINVKDKEKKKKVSKSKNVDGPTENPNPNRSSKGQAQRRGTESRPVRPIKCTKAVVMDVGTGFLKSGFAGDNAPSCIIPMGTARPGPLDSRCGFVGFNPSEELNQVHYKPVHNGIITEWDAMERLWEQAYSTLGIPSEEHAVLLSDPPLSPSTNREKMAEVMFETFSCPAMFIENQSVLSLYSYGRTSGLVLECGHGCSYVVPIDDGYYVPNYTSRAAYAGGSLDLHLLKLLQDNGKRVSCGRFDIIADMKASCCYVSNNMENEMSQKEKDVMEYKLPDGSCIMLGDERFQCPEALFQPRLIGSREPGLPAMIMNSVDKCDITLKKDVLKNIVLCGGSTMFRGFTERLQSELQNMAPGSGATIIASQERWHAVWLGGSILASLSSFQSLWLKKQVYEETGPNAIYRTFFKY